MNKMFLVIIGFILSIFIVAKLIGGTDFVAGFLALSLPIIFILGKSKGRTRFFAIIIGLLIMGIDFFLLIIMIVPTNSYNIQTRNYYKNKENYMKIYIKDKKSDLNGMAMMIKKEGKTKRDSIKFPDYKDGEKIIINENDKIYFLGQKKHKSYAVIYLWDDSILRITPGTKLNMTKLTKNLENMSDNQTNIQVEQGNIWFSVMKMVKNSSNMNIENAKGQTLIIRGTAGMISIDENTTYAFDYDHFIEIKSGNESVILKEGEGVILSGNKMEVTDNLLKLLNSVGVNPDLIKEFKIADEKDIKQIQTNIINYINEQVGVLGGNELFQKMEGLKLKIYSVGNDTYKQYLSNLKDYQYLIGEGENFTRNLIGNENIAFMASVLEKQKLKTSYLINEMKENITNSDIYKTYIVNLGIEGKIKDVNEEIGKTINKFRENPESLLNDIDSQIDNLIKF